jgi:type II pantothenate kinase
MMQVPTVVEKAIASEGGGDGPRRRGMAFGRAFAAHLAKLQADPGCYGQLGLSDLFEMREECLREFGFSDVYRCGRGRLPHNGCRMWRTLHLLFAPTGIQQALPFC